MPIQDYSTDPDLNVQISGINIAEGCPPSGINNAIRQLMADVKEESEAQAEAITAAGEALEAFAEEQALVDASQDEAIAEAKSSAEAAGQAAANAQSSADAAKNSVPTGSVIAFAANSEPPGGYLLCNGAAVSRTTYADLFSAIGTTYGMGDGSTTFNLPNLTDKFIQGSSTAGTVKAAGAPNITGLLGMVIDYGAPEGAFVSVEGSRVVSATQKTGTTSYDVALDAARSSTVYGASTTVQPPALTMRYYIKY